MVVDTADSFDDVRQRFEFLTPTIDFAELTKVIETYGMSGVQQYTAEHAPNSFVNDWTLDPTPMMPQTGHRSRAVTYTVGSNVATGYLRSCSRANSSARRLVLS